MTVWSVEAVQVRATESCEAEAWRLVGAAGGLAPVAPAVGVTSWLLGLGCPGDEHKDGEGRQSGKQQWERRKTPGGSHDSPPAGQTKIGGGGGLCSARLRCSRVHGAGLSSAM